MNNVDEWLQWQLCRHMTSLLSRLAGLHTNQRCTVNQDCHICLHFFLYVAFVWNTYISLQICRVIAIKRCSILLFKLLFSSAFPMKIYFSKESLYFIPSKESRPQVSLSLCIFIYVFKALYPQVKSGITCKNCDEIIA